MNIQANALIPMRWAVAKHKSLLSALLLSTALTFPNSGALADEGGVSFWIPGFFGSLAASPLQPGWSVATIYYHTSVDASGDVAFARQVARGNIRAIHRQSEMLSSMRTPISASCFQATPLRKSYLVGN
jgi:hypothetical protein